MPLELMVFFFLEFCLKLIFFLKINKNSLKNQLMSNVTSLSFNFFKVNIIVNNIRYYFDFQSMFIIFFK